MLPKIWKPLRTDVVMLYTQINPDDVTAFKKPSYKQLMIKIQNINVKRHLKIKNLNLMPR